MIDMNEMLPNTTVSTDATLFREEAVRARRYAAVGCGVGCATAVAAASACSAAPATATMTPPRRAGRFGSSSSGYRQASRAGAPQIVQPIASEVGFDRLEHRLDADEAKLRRNAAQQANPPIPFLLVFRCYPEPDVWPRPPRRQHPSDVLRPWAASRSR
jgi:hypothetical protein